MSGTARYKPPGVQTRTRHSRPRAVFRLAAGLSLLLVSACTRALAPAGPREWSGFLDDYSRLREGSHGELAFEYRNPTVKWTAYDKVMIEPVTLWRSGKHSLDPIPEGDLVRLVSRFEIAVRRRLGVGFQLVDAAGPGTMRLRLAVTEARASDPVLDVLTANPDEADAVASGALGAELERFVDAAVIEGELRDAETDEILAAGVDQRRSKASRIATWAELDRAFDFWADRVCGRLEARAGRGAHSSTTGM